MAQDTVLIPNDRIYAHRLVRFYYTTYDVQRMEDIINPRTSHCNIMMLNSNWSNKSPAGQSNSSTDGHPFLYGRVIGIYHTNVVYIGPGMKDYEPVRFDFLHVRWFKLEEPRNRKPTGHVSSTLHCLSFPPVAHKDSFSFVDPGLVLRSCHLIPAFSRGKLHPDGIGISLMSKDHMDWKFYYINM